MADELGRLEVDVTGDLTPLRAELAAFAKKQRVSVPIGVKITQAEIRTTVNEQAKKMRTSAGGLPKVNLGAEILVKDLRAAVKKTVEKAEKGAGLPQAKIGVYTTPTELRRAVKEANAKAEASKTGLPTIKARLEIPKKEMKKTEKEAEAIAHTAPIDLPVRIDPKDLAVKVTVAKELMEKALKVEGGIEVPVELSKAQLAKFSMQMAAIKERANVQMDVDTTRANLKIREIERRAELARERIQRPIVMRIRQTLRGARDDLASLDQSFNRFVRSAIRGFNIVNAVGVAAFGAITAYATYEFAKVEAAATRASGVFASTRVAAERAQGDEIIAINEEIRDAVLQTSNEVALATKFDVEEAAEGIQFLAQAGVSQEQALQSVGTIAEFAQAANIDLQTATNDMAAGFIAAGHDIDTFGAKVDGFADKLVFVAQNAPISMEQTLAAFRNTAAATFEAFQQTEDEALNVIGLFGRSGFRGEMAGTQASILIREINRSALRKAPEAWEEMGIRILDANKKAVPFSKVLDQIAAKLSELQETEGDAAFDILKTQLDLTERSSRGLTQILPQVIALQKNGSSAFEEMGRIGSESMGRLDVQTEIVLQTLSLQFENFVNGIQVMAMKFAEPFGNALTDFFRELNGDAEGSTDQMAALADKAAEMGKTFAEEMQPFLDQLRGSEGRAFFAGIRDGFISLLRGIQGMVQEFSRALGGSGNPTSTLESFGNISRELGRIAEQVYPKVGEYLGKFFAFIRDNQEDLARFAKLLLGLVIFEKINKLVLLPLANTAVLLTNAFTMLSKVPWAKLNGGMGGFAAASGNAKSAFGAFKPANLVKFAKGAGAVGAAVALAKGAFDGLPDALDDVQESMAPVNESLEEMGVEIPELREQLEWLGEFGASSLSGAFDAVAAAGEGAIRTAGLAVSVVSEATQSLGRLIGTAVAVPFVGGINDQMLEDLDRQNKAAMTRIKENTQDASLDITSSLMNAGAKFLRPFSEDLADEAESWARVMDSSFGEIDITPEIAANIAAGRGLFDQYEKNKQSLKDQRAIYKEIVDEANILKLVEQANEGASDLLPLLETATGRGAAAARAREVLNIKDRATAIRGLSREYETVLGDIRENTVGNFKDLQEAMAQYKREGLSAETAIDDVRRQNAENRQRELGERIREEFGIDMTVDISPQINRFAVATVKSNIAALVEQKRQLDIDPTIPADVRSELKRRIDEEIKFLQGQIDQSPPELRIKFSGIDFGQIRPGTEFMAPGITENQLIGPVREALENPELVNTLNRSQRELYIKVLQERDRLLTGEVPLAGTANIFNPNGLASAWTPTEGETERQAQALSTAIETILNRGATQVKTEQAEAQIKDEFYARGDQVIQGFLEGLAVQAGKVNREGYQMGLIFDQGLDQYMNFGSPSRKMMIRGAWAAQGFSVGIISQLDEMRKVVARFVEAAGEEFDGGVNTLKTNAAVGGFAIMQKFYSGLGLGYLTQVLPELQKMPGRVRLYLNTLATAVSTVAGKNVMRGFKSGMDEVWEDTVKPFVVEIAEWIKENKGPIAYDKQLLQPAGEAIMSGFHRGLRDGFGEIKGWIKQVGPDFARHTIPENLFFKRSATFLLDNYKADADFDPNEVFNDLLPTMVMGSGALGANTPFGQSTGLEDTIRQALMVSEAFGIPANVASARLRAGNAAYNAAIGGAAGSLHVDGRAMDFGLAGTTADRLDAAAAWARQYMGTVFEEVLWRTTGHYDHLHLGWIRGTEKFFDYMVNDLAGATEPVEKALQDAAKATGVSFPLLAGLAKAESGFNPFAQSPVGAQGLTQLMPATARSVGVLNPFDPSSNALGGAKYLARQLNAFGGDVRMALAAYNAGPGNAARALASFPETMAYVERVLRFAREFGFRFGGMRAQGGPVMPGAVYGVGERGPEAFVASDRGQIISAADLKALVRAARDGEMMQPVQPMQVTFDTKVQTQSRDPEVAAALVDQRLAERIGSLSR